MKKLFRPKYQRKNLIDSARQVLFRLGMLIMHNYHMYCAFFSFSRKNQTCGQNFSNFGKNQAEYEEQKIKLLCVILVILSLFVYQTSRTNVPCSIHPMYLFILENFHALCVYSIMCVYYILKISYCQNILHNIRLRPT